MALFSRAAPSPDLRSRDRGDQLGHLLGWHERDEAVVHVVVLMLLRLTAGSLDRDAVLAEGARVGDPVTHGLVLAPVAAGFSSRVTRMEVRDQVTGTGGIDDHLFRVVG